MDEAQKDCLTHHGRLPTGKNPWLIQAAKVYTMEIFTLFEKEVRDLIEFSITKYLAVPNTSIECFEVTPRDKESRSFEVQLDTSTFKVSCGCHKFESFGILCSHALKVFGRVDLNFIPEIYIKKRWSKAATNRISNERRTNKSSGASEMIFINEMMKKCYAAFTRANRCNETRLILAESFENGIKRMNAWFDNTSINEVNAKNDFDVVKNLSQTPEILVRDPLNVKGKGVTDVRDRHCDARKKKTKRKGESSKRTVARGKKRQVQSSHGEGEECPSQGTREKVFLQCTTVSQPNDTYAYHPQTPSFTALLHQAGFHH